MAKDKTQGSKLRRQQGASLVRHAQLAAKARGKTNRGDVSTELKLLSGTALTLGMGLGLSHPTEAATFNVTNLSDSGAGSLRQAIEDANTTAGADTITFRAGLTGTITLTTGQLAVTDSVDIQGPGAATLAVSGNNASRVFYLYNGSTNLAVTISGLTVTEGNASIGAGIVNFDEDLILDSVMITNNTATGDGGGLWADGFDMDLTIRNSIISGNTAGDDGGGIYIEDTGGPLLIQNTNITGNDATGSGGGIYFYDPDNDTTIENSTISGNTAGGLGGGIYLYNTDNGTLTIHGTTISGNTAAAGGGIFLYDPNPLIIENSTISGNQATDGDGGGIYLYSFYTGSILRHSTIAGNSATGAGGGLFIQNSEVTIEHTIVADNTAGANSDLSGSFAVNFSLIETPGTATITGSNNIFGQDPQLGPLANNGGPTQTHLPATASSAVNVGDPAFTPPPATDQRGLNRVVNGRIDIGAVEVNPGTIQLSAGAVSVNESTSTVTITATRTGGADGAVSVGFASSNGTAVAPSDYTAAAGTLNWADGDGVPKTFQIMINNDLADEPNETFTITISNPLGGVTLGATTTEVVTITDNDTAPVVTIGDVSVTEGGNLVFPVSLSSPPNGSITLTVTTSNGTAVAPGDYTARTVPVTFAAGETRKTVSVPTVQDTIDEPNETLRLRVQSVNAGTVGNTTDTGTGTIVDNDLPLPAVIIGDASVTEGRTLVFPVSLSSPSGGNITLTVATSNGTAVAPGDYTARTVAVTFAAGETSKTVSVPTVQDTTDEPNETLTLRVQSVNAGTVGSTADTGRGTIVDNDPAPAVLIDDVSVIEGRALVFPVSLSNPSSGTIRLTVATNNGMAVAPGDYTARTVTLTFAAGETSKTVTVPTVQDLVGEGDETLALRVQSVNAGAVGSTTDTGTGTIWDDEVKVIPPQ
jgi:parallel beta-helix repeat protein